jgi:hypothetical protein
MILFAILISLVCFTAVLLLLRFSAKASWLTAIAASMIVTTIPSLLGIRMLRANVGQAGSRVGGTLQGPLLAKGWLFLLPVVICAVILVVQFFRWLLVPGDNAVVNTAERSRILKMVEEGKIKTEEGAELLDAMGRSSALRGQDRFSRLDIAMLVGVALVILGFFLPWADFNRAAVDGLLARWRGRVVLAPEEPKSGSLTNAPLVSKSTVLGDDVAYLRVTRVVDGSAAEVAGACQRLMASNSVKGIVLDLRFADGEDYAAAAATADLFIAKQRPLLDWGGGIVESKEKTNAMVLPVTVLVNRETSGAPEALAAVMRHAGVGLILGSATAGNAMILRDFPLSNGQRLRVGVARVRLADGSLVPAKGVPPDIAVAVDAADERAYLEDAYAVLHRPSPAASGGSSLTNAPGETNRLSRRLRISEADLVRERREGTDLDADFTPARDAEPEQPLIRDPALARAVDLLKGLAVVRRSRS